MFQVKFAEEIKTGFLGLIIVSEKLAVYEIKWKSVVE
jgi:hypothetical protein